MKMSSNDEMTERQKKAIEMADKLTFENALDTAVEYHATRKYWIITVVGIVITASMSILVDFIMPMNGLGWNLIRALLALAGGVFDFMLAYSIAVFQSVANEKHYDDDVPIDEVVAPYMPFRLRFSIRQRRRQSYPFIAIILVLIIASAYSHLYTLFGGIVFAGCIAIAAYLRPTPDERVLLENDMPDARDIVDIAEEYEKEETARKAKEKAKALRKARKELDKETDKSSRHKS